MNRLPYLSESQRRGLLILEWLIVLGFLGAWIYSSHDAGGPEKQGKYGVVNDSMSVGSRDKSYRKSDSYVYSVQEEPVETFTFDPNTADSTTLLRLGLAPWQVRSIYRYRAKHGRYHRVEDFKRLPGMTNELWERLSPYVRIGKEFQYVDLHEKKSAISIPQCSSSDTLVDKPLASRDTIQHPEKYSLGTLVDINTADTNQLKRIPGIASIRAGKIVAYRQKLGGFVKVDQAMEACELPDDVLQWMTVGQIKVKRLNVNKLSLQKLMNHPYITFYQARAIVEYRKGHGDLHSLDELSRLEGFTSEKIDRLQDYIEF